MAPDTILAWRDEPLPKPARERKWVRVAREIREAYDALPYADADKWAVVLQGVGRETALAAARELRGQGLDARTGYDEAQDAFEVAARVHPPTVQVKPEEKPSA